MNNTQKIDYYLALYGYNSPIQVISGEGFIGQYKDYTGKRSGRAVLLKLAKERCNGDRWAKALMKIDKSAFDYAYNTAVNLETGELETWLQE